MLALGTSLQTQTEQSAAVRADHASAACRRVESAVYQAWRDVTAWSDDIREAAASIAAYTLISFRGYGPAQGADAGVKARYDAALAWLDLIAKGLRTPGFGFAGSRVARWHVSSDPSRYAARIERRREGFCSGSCRTWSGCGGC